jgi:chlorophyll/bacteriochlorophyll a synthase
MEKLRKFIDTLMEKKISPVVWLVNFLGVISLRLFLDKFIARANAPLFDLVMDIHNILFFFLNFILIWAFLSFIFKKKPFELAYFMSWASLALIFPSIIDLIKTGGEVYWSFYLIGSPQDLWQQFITIYGHSPSGIVYFGTKIVFVVAVISLFGLVFLKTKSIWKSIITAFVAYAISFFVTAFPSLFAFVGLYFQKGKNAFDVQPFEIVQFFSSIKIFGVGIENPGYSLAYNLNFIYFLLILGFLAVVFFWSEKRKFLSALKNFRYPQLTYHLGLFFCGAGLGYWVYPQNFSLTTFSFMAFVSLLMSVILSWEASVVVNDLNDIEIDKISNQNRPLTSGIFEKSQFKDMGIVVFVLALIGGFMVNYKFGMLLIIYQILAWFYSAKPYRLKIFPGVATLISSFASMIVLFMGFILFSPNQNLAGFPWRIFFLLLIGFALCLPIKDFKDIAGDKADGVMTIPVIFGEEKGRLIVAVGFFISFLSSVFFLNEMKLFWWALLFGGVSFLIITNKRIKPYDLLWWNLGVAFFYGLILVKIIFIH